MLSFRFVAVSFGLLLVASVFPTLTYASGHGGFHVPLGQNEGHTSYSATIATTTHGVWIAVHAHQSYSGSYAVPGNASSTSSGYGAPSGATYNQVSSGTGSASASNVVRSWTNGAGEPFYQTTSGQVYHFAGINIGNASAGPNGWFPVGMRQHPGTVPEALYVNGKLQGIIWVPTGANGGALHWGVPPSGNANAATKAPVVVDPRVVAANVLRHIPLPNVQLRMNPTLGLVALPGWFWTEGYNGAPFGGSATVGGLTVSVQVQPSSYTWTFGDGTSLTSPDLGQPYPAQSDIQHTYQYSSLHFPTGFPIHLTIQFAATYSVNAGAFQPLASMTRTYAANYRVQELQSVLTNR